MNDRVGGLAAAFVILVGFGGSSSAQTTIAPAQTTIAPARPPISPAPTPIASGSTTIGRNTRPVRLLRTWYDDIKTRRGDLQRRVEIVYDYPRATAYERAYTLDGRMLWSRRIRVNPPQPTPEEIAEAKDIVRADPELSRVMTRFSAELEGGFLAEEKRGRACGPGTRCVLVQVVAPHHAGLIRWTAVDLVQQRIAYSTFVPSERGGVK